MFGLTKKVPRRLNMDAGTDGKTIRTSIHTLSA
jgi:hypothetical protein